MLGESSAPGQGQYQGQWNVSQPRSLAALSSSHPLPSRAQNPRRSSRHPSLWRPPNLGCWHGNRPLGTPRAGTTVWGPAGGGRGKVGTRQMDVSAGSLGWGMDTSLSAHTCDDCAQVVRPTCHPHPHSHRTSGPEKQRNRPPAEPFLATTASSISLVLVGCAPPFMCQRTG